MKTPFFRSGYNYDRDLVSVETGLVCPEETLAVQSEKDEADINTIVRRFGLTGVMPEVPRVPMFGDFTDVGDYRTALDMVREADRAFYELTPEVRAVFENDPQKLMDFCSAESLKDEKNLVKARELGLVPKAAVAPVPLKVEVVNQPLPAAAGGAAGGSPAATS